jgi:hypothetical protein
MGHAVESIEGIYHLVCLIFGWPLQRFGRWLDRQPHQDPSQISTMRKAGRLLLGASVGLAILMPLGWFVFR